MEQLPLTFASSIQTLTDLFPQVDGKGDIKDKLQEIIDIKAAFQRFGLSIFIKLGLKGNDAFDIIAYATNTMEENISILRDFLDNHTSGGCSNETCNNSIEKAFFNIEMAYNIAMIDLPDAIIKGI